MKTLHKNTSAVFYAGKVKTLEMIARIRTDLVRISTDFFNPCPSVSFNPCPSVQTRISKKESEVRTMKKLILILALVLIFPTTYDLRAQSYAYAEIPHLISYQGRLTNTAGAPVPNGTYSVTFRLYTQEAGGPDIWSETHSVTATDGIFEVLMGSNASLDLPFDVQYYLGIQVGSDPEMTPRQKLSSSGYAYRAAEADHAIEAVNAETVSGIEVSATPEPNKLIALDAEGRLPESVVDYPYAAGGSLIAYSDGEDTSASDSYEKKKEIRISKAGTLRISFKARGSTTNAGYARIYRNGSPVGIDHRLISGSYVPFEEDIAGWSPGDLCQLYLHKGGVGNRGYAKEFRIYINKSTEAVTQGTGPNSP